MRTAPIFFILFIVCLSFTSCVKQRIENAVKETLGKSIIFDNQDSIKSKYTIIRVLKNPVCTSCELHLGDWRIYRRRLNRDFGDSINFVFIVNTHNINETNNLLQIYKFDKNAIIGDDLIFFENNKFPEVLGRDFVLLLDSINKVISIGNPCSNVVAERNFDKIFYNR